MMNIRTDIHPSQCRHPLEWVQILGFDRPLPWKAEEETDPSKPSKRFIRRSCQICGTVISEGWEQDAG